MSLIHAINSKLNASGADLHRCLWKQLGRETATGKPLAPKPASANQA
ncbi:hypothetical protein [Xanthomonas arboricola]